MRRALLLCALLAAAARAQDRATVRPGDWDRPLPIPALPFAHAGTTVGRASKATRYAPKPQASEAGPEVAYRLTLPVAGRLVAWVEGDDGPRVDIDVHLLTALALDPDGSAPRCVARGDVSVEADLPAGECFVVVDTYVRRDGVVCPGPYRLRVELLPAEGWHERPLARGVTLRTRRYADLRGARQQASLLVVDPRQAGVSVRPVEAQGCQPTSLVGRQAGAVAAVNAGFFDVGAACRSVSLLKTKGQLRATNAKDRSAFGTDAQGRPRFALVPAGRDWPEVTDAVGGVGRLLDAGQVVVAPGAEGSATSFATARHPRTLVGLRASGELVLAAVDGRTAVGAGLTLAELAAWARDELLCQDALNLDGGGSTCLWVRDGPWGGVVNEPSDGGEVDHAGERQVGSVLAVFAPPLERPPVWLVAPPATLDPAGGACELAAADPEAGPVTFACEGATLEDRGDGTARLTWSAGTTSVRVVARAGTRETPAPR